MGKVTELRNFTVGVRPQGDGGGAVLTLEDKHTRETLWIGLPRAVAEELASALTQIASGVVIPNRNIFDKL